MSALDVIELMAGVKPDGTPVVERLQVQVQEDDSCQLVRSPAFIKGIASKDVIKLNKDDQSFEVIKRSGNLCLRVFSRQGVAQLAEELAPQLEKLGGELDFENERMLVFSIHVSCGFQKIEALLDDHIDEDEGQVWMYGNVYDPKDGVTPLNWWNDILKPQ